MGKQTFGRTKKMLGITMLALFVMSMAVQSVFAQASSDEKYQSTSAAPSVASAPPMPIPKVNVVNPCEPLKVYFRFVPDSKIRIISAKWTFGDGQTSTTTRPTHVYRAGTFKPSVTVTYMVNHVSVTKPITNISPIRVYRCPK
jgi:PKD repeat protein